MRGFSFIRSFLIPVVGLGWALSLASARAGSAVSLVDRHEVAGKVTLSAAGIHVEGSPPSDIKLADVLEANFSDVPFGLQYFQSEGDTSNHLPSGWTAKAIGPVDPGGSASYAAGALTIAGNGSGFGEPHPDHVFFAGLPWNGDGEWTARMTSLAPPTTPAQVGLTLRKTLDENGAINNLNFSGDIPVWIRVTRIGNSVDARSLTDGTWDVTVEEGTDHSAAWLGFVMNSQQDKVVATAVIDHISFNPAPAQPETVPPGILLKSGSFLSGEKILAEPDFFLSATDGGITINNKRIVLKPEKVAAVVYHPLTRQELASAVDQQGLVLRNGDFLASDVQLIQGGMAQMNSLALGQVGYYPDQIRACVVNPVGAPPSDYEVRLTDGSNVRAKSVSVTDGQVTMEEIGGISITVDASEIAQVRAGSSRVQSLVTVPWKVSEAVTQTTRVEVPSAKPATDTPVTTDTEAADAAKAAATNLAVATRPGVVTWEGPNQEQMLVIPAGRSIDFPLKGKFKAVAMRLTMAPVAVGEMTLHVSTDGQEMKQGLSVKSGAGPTWVDVAVQDPKTVTFRVDSSTPGARLLVIDPVAVRDAAGP